MRFEKRTVVQWFRNLTGKQKPRRKKQRGSFRLAVESLETREMPAANLFVATAGNDTAGRGTVDSPYATLAKALSVAQPGDTVVLRAGTYAGGVRVDDPNVTIRSFENEWAVVSAPTNNANIETVIRFSENASGGKLQRLEIEGGYYYGVKLDGGANPSVPFGASGVIIEDSRIHDTGRDAIKITPGVDDVVIRRNEIFNSGRRDSSNAEGIDNVNGDRMIVQDNYIHDIATNGLYAKGGSIGTVIERNLIRNTGGAGILFGFRNTDAEWFDTTVNPNYYENIDGVIRNNIIVNTTYAGIGLYAAKNATITNNTLVDVAQAGQAAVLIDTSETYIGDNPPLLVSSRDTLFANNIVKLSSTTARPAFEIRTGGLSGSLQTAANGYFHAGNSAGFRDRRVGNEFIGGLAGWQSHVAGETGSFEGDPRLDTNLHLLAGSPCIDAGNSQFTVSQDYDGNVRSGSVDIGADEAGTGIALTVPPPAGTIGTGAEAALQNPPGVSFAVASSLGSESVTATQLVVSLSAASTQSVTVGYSVGGGTATPGADFALAAGTLTFAPGQTVAFIPLTVTNDALDEYDETLTVALSNPVGAVLGNIQTHTYTIQDNDAMPQVQFSFDSTRFNESTLNGSVAIRLSAVSGRPVTVAYRVVRGTATAGVDYRITNGTLTFQPGQIQRSIPVAIVDDLRDEVNENFVLSLFSSPTNAVLGIRGSHVITILDNDPPPSIAFSQASSSINESAGNASVNVALSAPSANTVRINYAVLSGTATSGIDFTGNSGTLVFRPGETVKSVPISITNDLLLEPNETVRIQLSGPSNGILGAITSHTVTIVDNDTPTPAGQAFITFRLPNGQTFPGSVARNPLTLAGALSGSTAGSGDFNGDGVADTYSVSTSGVSITRGGNGGSKFYPFSGAFAVNKTADTDGVAGGEIVVATRSGISVIRDRNQTSKLYSFTGTFGITGVSNLDGQPGDEISVRHGTNGRAMIIDRTGIIKML